MGVVSSLIIGLLVWLLGSRWGAMGMGLGLLSVLGLVIVPYGILRWFHFRELWYAPASPS